MSTSEKIRIALIKRNMTISALAEAVGSSSQNLSAKLKRNNFSEKDLKEISKALNCTLNITFIDNETGESLI